MRVPIPKVLRFEVFKRDGFRCQYCGAHPPAAILECDHIHPLSKGGSNDADNLITACEPCNRGKTDRLLSDIPSSLQERAEIAEEREHQIAGYEAVMRARRERLDDQAWIVAEEFMGRFGDKTILRDRFTSIRRFVDLIGLNETLEAMQIATGRVPRKDDCFRFFCGIGWNKARGRRDDRQLHR